MAVGSGVGLGLGVAVGSGVGLGLGVAVGSTVGLIVGVGVGIATAKGVSMGSVITDSLADSDTIRLGSVLKVSSFVVSDPIPKIKKTRESTDKEETIIVCFFCFCGSSSNFFLKNSNHMIPAIQPNVRRILVIQSIPIPLKHVVKQLPFAFTIDFLFINKIPFAFVIYLSTGNPADIK